MEYTYVPQMGTDVPEQFFFISQYASDIYFRYIFRKKMSNMSDVNFNILF